MKTLGQTLRPGETLTIGKAVIRAREPGGGPLTLRLPLPPSANNMFANIPHRGRVPSERYKTWRRVADTEIMVQNRNPRRTFASYVHVHILLGAPDDRARDGDNLVKPVLDTLKRNGIIADDSNRFVKRGTWEWADGIKGCVVTIAPLVVEVA